MAPDWGSLSRMPEPRDEPTPIEIASYYARGRNALVVRAELGALFMDYYVHQMDHGLRASAGMDGMLKDALAALLLHLVSRPVNEVTAWTVSFREPAFNLFVTGDSRRQSVVGRLFAEGVKETPGSRFHAQVHRDGQEVRGSMVNVSGNDMLRVVEQFYRQSEQLPARFFRLPGDEFAMVAGMPDCDEEWIENLEGEGIAGLAAREELKPMERRAYAFRCGCDLRRILPAVAPLARDGLDPLFQGDERLVISCPRCAARFVLTREAMEAFLKES